MHAFPRNARRSTPAFVLALALLGALGFGGWQASQQARMAPGTAVSLEALAAPTALRSSDMRPAHNSGLARGPGWEQLDTPQKLALYPLAPRWAMLGEQHKRQWLAIAQGFSRLPEAEQERLHLRMADWASLSAQQRSQARLNYAATNRLAPDSKRAQWEAYQALSSEEKNRLAAVAAATSRQSLGAAPPVRPVAPRKLPACRPPPRTPRAPPTCPRSRPAMTPARVRRCLLPFPLRQTIAWKRRLCWYRLPHRKPCPRSTPQRLPGPAANLPSRCRPTWHRSTRTEPAMCTRLRWSAPCCLPPTTCTDLPG